MQNHTTLPKRSLQGESGNSAAFHPYHGVSLHQGHAGSRYDRSNALRPTPPEARIMKPHHHKRLVVQSTLAVVAFLAILFLPVGHAVAATKPDLYALVVGIGKYRHAGHLPTVPHGAAQIFDFLAQLKGTCFNAVYRIVLVDEQATKENIESAIKELSKARKDDVVFIYLEGHGSPLTGDSTRYYFTAYDTGSDLIKTGLWINNRELFRSIQSERVLFLTGSCFSGGFLDGLARARTQGAITDFLGDQRGRFGVSAARANEVAWMSAKYGMSLFSFYVIKALRGHAAPENTGKITVNDLYTYVRDNVCKESGNAQNPDLFHQTSNPAETPIVNYSKALELDVKFFYETDDHLLKVLTDESVLKSGQHVGIAFKAKTDCYVQVLWWDSQAKLVKVFPNPQFGEGTGHVKAGETVWLPYKGKKHWYVLDNQPGTETVYFVATR